MKTDFIQKIKTLPALTLLVNDWKIQGNKIVFTNGCFDILHQGHVDYLQQAAQLGDRLIVAINSDESVSILKGKHRPIQHQESRSHVVAALGCVDAVIIFDESTPLRLIQSLTPDVLAKGGDWQIDQIVGADHVLAHGGEVRLISFISGHSTSLIEQKIIRDYENR